MRGAARPFPATNPALGSVSSEDGRRWSVWHFQSVMTALNKRRKCGSSSCLCSLARAALEPLLHFGRCPVVAPEPPVVAAGPWDSGHPALPEGHPNEPTHNLLQLRCSAWKLPPGRGLMASCSNRLSFAVCLPLSGCRSSLVMTSVPGKIVPSAGRPGWLFLIKTQPPPCCQEP